MKILGDKLVLNRGESFKVAFNVKDASGVPLVLPKLNNPYLLFSVASERYEQHARVAYNYWTDYANVLQFERTTPENFPGNLIPSELPQGYNADTTVWYQVVDGGNAREYYYWDGSRFVPYSFVVERQFYSYDTINWVDKNYTYEIRIVDGEPMNVILTGIWNSLYDGTPPQDNKTLYDEIYRMRPDLVKGLNYAAPLGTLSVSILIQSPKRLIVYSNN